MSVSYRDQYRECQIGRELKGGWLVADIVFGLLPLIVDAATGNWYGPNASSCTVGFLAARERPPPGYKPRRPTKRDPVDSRGHDDLVKLCDAGVERYCAILLKRAKERETRAAQETCARSEGCREQGLCTATNDGKATCKAATNDDCLGSMACRDGGACTLLDGICVKASGDLDVRTSTTPRKRRKVFSPGQ